MGTAGICDIDVWYHMPFSACLLQYTEAAFLVSGGGDSLWTEVCGQQKQSTDPGNDQHILNTYANYWAPLTRKRHTMPHSAQSQHTNYWAPRTRK